MKTKTVVPTKIKQKGGETVRENIATIVDSLGEIVDKIKELKEKETEYKEKLIALGEGKYSGELYTATVSTSVSYELDKAALYKRLGKDTYIEVSKVSMEGVKQYIAPAELQKFITEAKETHRVSVKKI